VGLSDLVVAIKSNHCPARDFFLSVTTDVAGDYAKAKRGSRSIFLRGEILVKIACFVGKTRIAIATVFVLNVAQIGLAFFSRNASDVLRIVVPI
jgi:hypothetical protein